MANVIVCRKFPGAIAPRHEASRRTETHAGGRSRTECDDSRLEPRSATRTRDASLSNLAVTQGTATGAAVSHLAGLGGTQLRRRLILDASKDAER